MTIEIRIVDPSLEQIEQLLEIFYPERRLDPSNRPLAREIDRLEKLSHADNPSTGSPGPGEAFGSTAIAPEVAAAFAASAAGNATGAPVAPIAPAPVGTPAAPAPAPVVSAPPGVELDSKGLPWDARIHAKSSNGPGGVKNGDGSWRAKRGLNDAALVARVEAELRAVLAAPAPGAASSVPLPPAAPPATPAPVAVAPSTPAAPVPPAPPADGGQPPMTFVELVGLVARAMGEQKLNEAEVTAACVAVGVPALPLLATRLDLVPAVAAGIQQVLASRP